MGLAKVRAAEAWGVCQFSSSGLVLGPLALLAVSSAFASGQN